MKIERDISNLVWVGILALLLLAVAVHEGWFGGSAPPLINSGTQNDLNPGGTYDGGVYNDPLYGPLPNWGS